jgi:HSP20 family protein
MIYNNSLLDIMDNVFSTVYGEPDSLVSTRYPHKVTNNDDDYVLEVSLPGFKKKDILMNVENNVLTIEYEMNGEENSMWKKSFSKKFSLNNSVNIEKITAKMEDGILKITLPKSETLKPKKLLIQ